MWTPRISNERTMRWTPTCVKPIRPRCFAGFPWRNGRERNSRRSRSHSTTSALAGYRLRWHGDIIYLCDYLEDGLTRGSARLEKQNPMGYAMMYNHMLLYPGLTRKEKFYAACQCAALSIYGRHAGYLLKSNSPGYTLAALPGRAVCSLSAGACSFGRFDMISAVVPVHNAAARCRRCSKASGTKKSRILK